MIYYLLLIISTILLITASYYISQWRQEKVERYRRRIRATVVVLGDFGRSPRMQYHAASLASIGNYYVHVVGFKGTPCTEEIISNKYIDLTRLVDPPEVPFGLSRFLFARAFMKVPMQAFILTKILVLMPKPRFILVQNPPSVPTLPILGLICACRGIKLVIDWHNYGYSILGISRSKFHPLVFGYKCIERFFGKLAVVNFCVSKAMEIDLRRNWNIKAHVLYDVAPSFFHPTPLIDQHELFTKNDFGYRSSTLPPQPTPYYSLTPWTYSSLDGEIFKRQDRSALVVSSTSWTADEDFGLLISAAKIYDRTVSKQKSDVKYPSICFVITGKADQPGLRKKYLEQIKSERFSHIRWDTAFLPFSDYAKLLGSADLGISLHYSSSGKDLPMKVVDMFGCHLPVCAKKYECIEELVLNQKTGLLFSTAEELAEQLLRLFAHFPQDTSELDRMKENIKDQMQDNNWAKNWQKTALPLLSSLV
eukprot:TRINITY_DN788_c0_g3_i1.p1 TRINITY_DN788_c0_g3~~TRINITY_DN788_c0_g3_i1.p1  ORF type:complete len:478 (-),score=53.93 TRINITY_DN788_c0_g3_i1:32-1465(-)